MESNPASQLQNDASQSIEAKPGNNTIEPYEFVTMEPIKNDMLGVRRNSFYKRCDDNYIFFSNASKLLLPN